MQKTTWALALGLAASMAGAAHAQQPPACPALPDGTNLHWESRIADGTAFCRALQADGTEAFGLYISAEPGFQPRTPDRKEQGRVDGHGVYWYRTEIAGGTPGMQGRETSIPLGGDRHAHVWLQAPSQDALMQRLSLVSRLRFGDDQVAAGR